MKKLRNSFVVATVTIGFCALAPRVDAGGQHAGDVIIGRDAAGKLKVEFDFSTVSSLSSVSTPIQGWVGDEPGLEALADDEPDEDFFTLASGNNIVFELVSFASAFKVYTPGFGQLLDTPGEMWDMGPSPHTHANWFIDSTDAGYSTGQQFWDGTFRIRDTGSTGYTMSDPFTLRFSNIPENVPTVSQWGVIVMVLAIAVAGTLILRWRGAFATACGGGLSSNTL